MPLIRDSLIKAYSALYSLTPEANNAGKLLKNAYRKGVHNPCAFLMVRKEVYNSERVGDLYKSIKAFDYHTKLRIGREQGRAIKEEQPIIKLIDKKMKELYPKTRKLREKILDKLYGKDGIWSK